MSTQSVQGSTSSIVHVEAIQWGGWRWVDPDQPEGWAVEIRYCFRAYGDADWTEAERSALSQAFTTWSDVANITFIEVESESEAQFVEYKADNAALSGNLGIHGTPELYQIYEYELDLLLGGNSRINGYYNADVWSEETLQRGGYDFVTLVHELGHGLGLAHPHDNGGGSGTFPGVDMPGDFGANSLNQGIYTVMSYNDGWQTISKPLSSDVSDYGYQAGPMAFDIAAVQALYGANEDYNSDDTTYWLPTANKAGTFWSCIWDSFGTDEIAYAGGRSVSIDLRAATLDNSKTGGGIPSFAKGIYGGVTIAHGVVIENASGGRGNDSLRGNASANELSGNAGQDKICAGAGNDTLDGGAGNDVLNGGAGRDTVSYNSAEKGVMVKLWQKAKQDTKGGGLDTIKSAENVTGSMFKDWLTGSDGANTIIGGDGDDWLNGLKGTDRLSGGSGADRFAFVTKDDASTDSITDFETGIDKIAISNAVFAGLGGDGGLDASTFVVGNATFDADDRIMYDPITGAFVYDSNGVEDGGQHVLAYLSKDLALTAGDVLVV